MQNLYTDNPENSVKDRDVMLRSSDCHRGIELEELLKQTTSTRQVLDNLTYHLSTINMVLTSIFCELFDHSIFCKLRNKDTICGNLTAPPWPYDQQIKNVSANMLQRTVDYPCLILLIFCWDLMESVIKCLYFSFWWQMTISVRVTRNQDVEGSLLFAWRTIAIFDRCIHVILCCYLCMSVQSP
jgi:hypothetical protein